MRVRILGVGIDGALDPLGIGDAGELEPPDHGRAGWYADGPEPGEPGRAVIAGHLDSVDGPDVFASLADVRPGDEVLVDLDDGTTVRFVVEEIAQFPQDDFPTERVYGGADVAELRLVTCGGPYLHDQARYQNNVVVFARQL